jgi:2-iminoacetate synthase ThiH
MNRDDLCRLIREAGFQPVQRTTTYEEIEVVEARA